MAEFKTITISIPVDVYERVEILCPSKRKGHHHVREFLTKIFLQGIESPEFLKAEKRWLAMKLQLAESLLKQQRGQHNSAALDSLARELELVQDERTERSEATPATEHSSEQNSSNLVPPDGKKSVVH